MLVSESFAPWHVRFWILSHKTVWPRLSKSYTGYQSQTESSTSCYSPKSYFSGLRLAWENLWLIFQLAVIVRTEFFQLAIKACKQIFWLQDAHICYVCLTSCSACFVYFHWQVYMSIFVILIIACSLLLHFYDVVIHFAYRPTSRSKLNDEQRA